MDLQIKGRVAIITGASRGLGRAIALTLLSEGVRVVGVARSHNGLQELQVKGGEAVLPIACDLTNPFDSNAIVDQCLDHFGQLDALINNAGIAPAGSFVKFSPADIEQVLRINVVAPALLAQSAGRYFQTRQAGKVINIASTSGLRGKPLLAAYSASKGALIRLTESLAAEWAQHGIQVNAIAPGAFATDAQQVLLEDKELMGKRIRKIPSNRMGNPEEMGPLVCYLVSPLSEFVTGSTFVIDGGEVSKL